MQMKDLDVFTEFETAANPGGLHAVSFGSDFCVATPAPEPGKVHINIIEKKISAES